MSDEHVLYDPTAEPRILASGLAPRLASLEGKRAGILDNSKANAGTLMLAVVERLQARRTASVTSSSARSRIAGAAVARDPGRPRALRLRPGRQRRLRVVHVVEYPRRHRAGRAGRPHGGPRDRRVRRAGAARGEEPRRGRPAAGHRAASAGRHPRGRGRARRRTRPSSGRARAAVARRAMSRRRRLAVRRPGRSKLEDDYPAINELYRRAGLDATACRSSRRREERVARVPARHATGRPARGGRGAAAAAGRGHRRAHRGQRGDGGLQAGVLAGACSPRSRRWPTRRSTSTRSRPPRIRWRR